MSAARGLWPSPSPSRIPAAIAITFLSAPASSTPITSGSSTPGSVEVAKSCCAARAVRLVRRRRHHRGRLALAHLRAKLGPESAAKRAPGRHSLDDRGHERERLGLDALGGAHHQRARPHRAGDRRPRSHRVTRRHRHDHPRVRHRLGGIARGAERAGQRHTGQEDRILVRAVDRFDHVGLVGPEPDGLALAREQIGQRRAPAPRAEHRDRRHRGGAAAAPAAEPILRPASSRSMLAPVQPDDRRRDRDVDPEQRRRRGGSAARRRAERPPPPRCCPSDT